MQLEDKIAAAILTEPIAENTTTGIGHDAITEEDLRDRHEVSLSLAAPDGADHEDSKPPKPARRRGQKKVSVTSDTTQPPATVGEVVSPDAPSAGAPANPPSAGTDLEDNAPQAPVPLGHGPEESTILDKPASAEAHQNTAATNLQSDHPIEEVGLEITIDPEFQKLCPTLSEEAYQLLWAEIERNGQLSPLTIWVKDEKRILLDGHHRHKILRELNRVPLSVEVQLENREDAGEWVIRNQFARRNLSPLASRVLRGMLYNAKKGKHGGARQASDQSEHLNSIAAQVGKETGVSPATVRRDARLAEAAEKLGVTKEMMAGTEKRSAKEIVATAFPPEELTRDAAPVTPARDEADAGADAETQADPYRSSAIYKQVQAIAKAIRLIPWGAVTPDVAISARHDIEAALPEAVSAEEKSAAESSPAPEQPCKRRSKKGHTQPGQTEFPFAEAKAEIDREFPAPAVEESPACAPKTVKKKCAKKADNNPAQLQLGLTDSQATDVQSINS